MKTKNKIEWWTIIGIILVAFTMRGPTSGVGPLVPLIRQDLGLSSGISGMLTTIPLLLYAAVAALAGRVSHRFQMRLQILVCLCCILSGILVRSYLGVIGLFAGTALLGFGIGVLNVIMPTFVRARFPGKIGLMMGLYTTGLTLFSAVASGCVLWLSQTLSGWQNALAVFAAVPLLALLAWLPGNDPGMPERREQARTGGASLMLSDRSYWYIALFMGLQSFLFFTMTAWLPSVLREAGLVAQSASLLMMVLQLVSPITKFAAPIAAQYYPARRGLIGILPGLFYGVGYLVILTSAPAGWPLWVGGIVIGLGSGMSMSLALTFVALKSKSQAESVWLSAFSQTVGYLLAAPGPFLIGVLYDASGSFTVPIFVILAVSAVMCYVGQKSGNSLKEPDATPS